MKNIWTVLLITFTTAAACSRPAAHTDRDRIKRGEYLVSIMGCGDCHTPLKMGPNGPEPDLTRVLSGHPEGVGPLPAVATKAPWLWSGAATNTAFNGPWGVSYAANLTPDPNTGLGIWTSEMFVNTLRTGKHVGVSREILPPMPWPMYRNATDEDLEAIYAYLRTIKPIRNHVPDVQPPAATVAAVRQ
jgi:mono/diheme cytochrome c family protein